MIGNNIVYILVIVETRVKGTKANKVIRRLGFTNWIRVESTGYAGGIWKIWNEELKILIPLNSFTPFLHTFINPKSGTGSFLFTFVYAEPCGRLRKSLWNDIINLHRQANAPWIVAGDFNAYMSISDKTGGAAPNNSTMRDF